VEQSPTRDTDSHAASHAIPWILLNPKVHHRVHMIPPLLLILSRMNMFHNLRNYCSKVHLNIFPSARRSPDWFLPYIFSNENIISILPYPMSASYIVHLVLHDFITRTFFGEAYKLQCAVFSSLQPLSPLRSKYSPQHPLLKYPQSVFFS